MNQPPDIVANSRNCSDLAYGQEFDNSYAGTYPAALADNVVRSSPRTKLPLSFQQLRILARSQSAGYDCNRVLAVTHAGPIEVELLKSSFRDVMCRHEILRTRFRSENGTSCQLIGGCELPEIAITDLGSRSKSEMQHELSKFYLRDVQKSFDLEQGPLVRAHILRMGHDTDTLLVTFHQLVADADICKPQRRQIGEVAITLSVQPRSDDVDQTNAALLAGAGLK